MISCSHCGMFPITLLALAKVSNAGNGSPANGKAFCNTTKGMNMTRDEFVKALGDALETEKLPNVVDVYVRAGMLKLDEPKSEIDRFCDAYFGEGCPLSGGPGIKAALDKAGLRIIEK